MFGGLTITDVTLGTASITDAVIGSLQVTNCISDLCVNDLSVVDGSVSGTLSINDAVIQNLDLAGGLTITDITLGTASITDAVIGTLQVTNCISDLCVNDLSVVDGSVSGTLSINDAVIQNLDLAGGLTITDVTLGTASIADAVIGTLQVTNCISDLCINNLSIVDGSVSGTLSINDAVIQNLDFAGGLSLTDVTINTASINDAVISTLQVTNCITNVCVDNLSVVDEVLSGTMTITPFNTAGVIHNNASGVLSSGLIVDADITGGTITNDKLATISSMDIAGAIVVRDGSGNFTTNMITIDGSVTNPTDVATKSYVDSAVSTGLVVKAPALVASTTNVTISGLQTIDGVALSTNNRVLLVGQTNPVQNGLWLAQAGAWTRPADFASGTQAGEAYVLVMSGNTNAGASWVCSTPTAIIDTDPLTFEQFSLPNSTTGANIGAGTGLVFANKTGSTLNFRSLIAGSHLTYTTNTNDITVTTDATTTNTASTLVARDASGNFSAGTITASLIGNVTGSASLNVLKSGDTMTGALQLPAGTTAAPSLRFTGSTTTGLSAATANTLSFSTAAIERMKISPTGVVTIDGLNSVGVVHTDVSGNLSTSLIVNADISGSAAIADSKLATISTAGKVANSATTATSSNTPNTIVLRDGSGNFSAGTITASLNGNATTATSTTSFSGSLAGDVTGTQSATVVSFVGGQSAANVASATTAANTATNANTANTIVKRDGSGNFSAGTITASLIGNVTGSASLNVLKSGDTMTGVLQLPAGTVAAPSLVFTGSTTTGLSAATANTLSFSTAATERMKISPIGVVTIDGLNSVGVVNTDASGNLSTSLIVNADISGSAAIADSELATISTAGKVANSATTATSSNTPNTIVLQMDQGILVQALSLQA